MTRITKKKLLNEIHKLRQRIIGLEMGIIKLTHGDKVCHRMSDELARMILIEGEVLPDLICEKGEKKCLK